MARSVWKPDEVRSKLDLLTSSGAYRPIVLDLERALCPGQRVVYKTDVEGALNSIYELWCPDPPAHILQTLRAAARIFGIGGFNGNGA